MMVNQEKFELAKSLLLDFKKYVIWIHKLAQGTEYDMMPCHIDICDTLQKYAEGRNEKRNLMINCPPGTGKSLLIQYFITWCFARIKNSMFCYVAFGERLIKKLSRDSRNLMMMPEWEELFGKEMDPSDKSVLNYHLISGGVRSGLTAGTVSSAMLGLDAGVPGIDGFSGMLIMDDPNSPEVVTSVHEQIELPEVYQRKLATRRRTPTVPTFCVMQRHCFTPETIIWTEDGKKTIKDVVENKYTGKVWSFNPSTQRLELKPIEGYIKNPKSRQEIFNILGVRCTGQHRVCTQRGVVLARDLKIGDKIISASNALDGSSGSAKFFSKLFLPIIGCYYFGNLFFGKISNWFKTVLNNSGNTTVIPTVLNVKNKVVRESVFTDKFLNRCRVIGNSDSKFCGKSSHVTNKGKMAILLGIVIVFPISAILKIIKTVIRWIIIKMSNNSALRPLANKCFKNKAVRSLYSMVSVFTKRYLGVSHIIGMANKLSANYRIHSAKIRNLVESFIANNISKFFIHTITSLDKQVMSTETYCVTVQDNHTLIVNETQGYIFGNSVNDFAGWVAKNEPDEWEWVVIPAIDAEGNSFYPKRYPIEELRRLEKQNPFMFAAMYQQCPVENYGAYFHEEWIRTYRATPEKFSKVFITTDFGFTTSGDKSLFCCWGLANDNNLYLLRSRMGKWESPDAKRYCVEFFNHCNAAFRQCRRVYVENTLSGLGFIQEMRREAPQMAIVPLKRGAKKNKMNRAESAMTWMEAGRVYFREADPNYVSARAELLAYNPSDKNPKDEWCFVAGTKVMTVFGEKNIEDIKVGDLLWTPIGVTKVLKTGKRIKPVITNLGLTGTEDHKIWNPLHFRFDNLGDVCYFEPRLIQRSMQWKILKSYLMVNGINLTKRQDIIFSTTKTMRKETGKCFTGLFGNIIRERRYLRAMLFIILTGTGVITTILTLCAFRLLNTLKSTAGAIRKKNGLRNTLNGCKILLKKHVLGTKAQKEEQKVLKCQEEPWTKSKKSELACCAESNSITSLQNGQTTEKSAITAKTVGNTKQNAVVYSIKTGNGVYVANSVLVSNCDNIGDATEIAFNTKCSSIFI